MSTFEVLITKIDDVFDHPNADNLSIIKLGGYNCISGKLENGLPRYSKGELVVYVPENTIVPEFMLKHGYYNEEKQKGMLAGTQGNRVKPIKLRGILSEGIIFPLSKTQDGYPYLDYESYSGMVWEGDNVAERLNMVKWEPPIPSSMGGKVINIGTENTLKYDIENIKKYPNVIYENEHVVMTEKLHGTFCMIGKSVKLNNDKLMFGNTFVASKGLGAQGLVFEMNEENLQNNIYTQVAERENLFNIVNNVECKKNFFILGEIYGKGVQNLQYGQQKPKFRAFDIVIDGEYVSYEFFKQLCLKFNIDTVPTLYEGPFSYDKLNELCQGLTTLDGHNILEGIVIKPSVERSDIKLGRVILKAISEKYLLNKNNTEYN